MPYRCLTGTGVNVYYAPYVTRDGVRRYALVVA